MELSLVASADTLHSDDLIQYDKSYLNRLSLIFGSNGSGKSTVLQSLLILRTNVVKSGKNDPDDKLFGYYPHKLRCSDPCSIEIYFTRNRVKYYYSLSFVEDCVISESLYYSPNRRMSEIFKRDGMEIHFSDRFERYSSNFQNGLLQKNKLLLSVAAGNTDSEEILDAYRFFREDLVFSSDIRKEHSGVFLSMHPEYKEKFVSFMNDVGIDVSDISVKREHVDVDNLPEELQAIVREKIGGASIARTRSFLTNRLFTLEIRDESSGTRRLYEFLSYYLEAMEKGRVLICDGLETAFHPEIVRYIIAKIVKNRASEAQLVGTTHSVELLDQNLVRRDQIFFTEFEKVNRCTNLYSLWDIRNVRNTENLRVNYLSGKYGALPMVKDVVEEGADE